VGGKDGDWGVRKKENYGLVLEAFTGVRA